MTDRPITPKDRLVLEEILVSEYHTHETLRDALGIEGSGAGLHKRLMALAKHQYVLRRPMADDRFGGAGGTYNVYILGHKALDEIDADPGVLSRYRARVRSAQNAKGTNIPHDLLRSRFRNALLAGQRRYEWILDRWIIKRELELYGHWNEREHQIQPDAFFTLILDGWARHYFLEVDTASYPVERSDPDGGSSIRGKLAMYESLYERKDGRLWRLDDSKLDISAFSVIHLIRESKSTNPALSQSNANGLKPPGRRFCLTLKNCLTCAANGCLPARVI